MLWERLGIELGLWNIIGYTPSDDIAICLPWYTEILPSTPWDRCTENYRKFTEVHKDILKLRTVVNREGGRGAYPYLTDCYYILSGSTIQLLMLNIYY